MRSVLIRTVVAGAIGLAASAHGATDPAVWCGETKVRAIGKGFASKLRCHSDAILRGSPSEATCLARAQQNLAGAFARATSRGGCTGGVTAAKLGFALDSWVAGAVVTLAPPTLPPLGPPTEASLRCARARLHALSQAFLGKLRCRAAAVRRGSPDETSCEARVQATFAAAFSRTGERGGCTPSADAATLGVIVQSWAVSAVAATRAPAVTPTPAPTATSTP